jgi:hypothetical protein
MAQRPKRKSKSVAKQALDLVLATPQVVAHRVTRMALAGPVPSPRDRKEFQGMVAEKHVAFAQAWAAINTQALVAHQTMLNCIWRSLRTPPWLVRAVPGQSAAQLHRAGAKIVAEGMEPLRRKAVANAKRLAKTPLF